jgi:hypothetical protein
VVGGKRYTIYRPHNDPAFFDIFVEKEHIDHLANKDLDIESRLQVIYRILKDQLRRAKNELMQLKQDRAKDLKRALSFKREIQAAAETQEKGSLARSFTPKLSRAGSVK